MDFYNKYLELKNQLGGDPNPDHHKDRNNEYYTKFILDTITSIKKLEKDKSYKVLIKDLEFDYISHICHHYSLFSLYIEPSANCCGIESPQIKETLKPVCVNKFMFGFSFETCNFIEVCKDKCVFNPPPELEMYDGIQEYTIYLYGDKSDPNFTPHSSREIDGIVWHKFNGLPFLLAVESDDPFEKHLGLDILNQFQMDTYPVPSQFYLDGKEELKEVNIVLNPT